MSYISTQIIGNLGNNAEVKYSQSGQIFIAMSVGAKARSNAETEWFDVTVWGRLAETMADLMQNNGALSKGSKVFVTGALSTNKYTKNDGTLGFSLRLNADALQLLGDRQGAQGQQQEPQQQQSYQQAPPPPPQNFQQQAPQQGYQQAPPVQGGYNGYGQ